MSIDRTCGSRPDKGTGLFSFLASVADDAGRKQADGIRSRRYRAALFTQCQKGRQSSGVRVRRVSG